MTRRKRPRDGLDELIERTKRHVEEIYLGQDDEGFQLTSMFLAEGPGGLHVIATPFAGETQDEAVAYKEQVLALLRLMFAASGVTHYVMVSEAWMAVMEPGTEPDVAALAPSQRSDRVEVVQLVGADRDGRKLGATWDIVREQGQPPRLGHVDRTAATEIEGRMASLLDEPPSVPEELRSGLEALFEQLATPLKH
jgi:hypothetical protein